MAGKKIEGKKVWFKTMTGRTECGIVEYVSDATGLIWVRVEKGDHSTTMITSAKSIEASGEAHRGLSSRRQMRKAA